MIWKILKGLNVATVTAILAVLWLTYIAFTDIQLFFIILNVFWGFLFVVFVVFVALGTLTVMGRKKEASRIIDMALQGSINFLDLINFLKELFNFFIQMLQRFLLRVSPILGYIAVGFVYILILLFYKSVGARYDVTVPTILLAFGVTFLFGVLTKPRSENADLSEGIFNQILSRQKFFLEFTAIFRKAFIDGFEVAIFLLFLTIDSTKLFFLPDKYNVSLQAKVFDYDFMIKSFAFNDHFKITLTFIVAGIILELARNLAKLAAVGFTYFRNPEMYLGMPNSTSTIELIKQALKKTVVDGKDDILRFSAFTTFMMAVFLLFPRLKLLALTTASATALILDVIIPGRLTNTKPTDLISRTFNKIFKLT